jgi:hypothetical protein
MRALILSVCFGSAFAGVATAQTGVESAAEGYTYFNRPGATLQQHRHDIENCFDPVAAMTAFSARSQHSGAYIPNLDHLAQAYGAAPVIAGSFLVGSYYAEQQIRAYNRGVTTNYENCMVARGWRLVRMEASVGRRLGDMDRPRLVEALGSLIAAEQPDGEILRTFANDLALQPESVRAERGRAVSLSLLAMPSEELVFYNLRRESSVSARRSIDARRRAADQAQERTRRMQAAQQRAASIRESVTLSPIEDFSTVPADASLVLVTLSGERTLTFTRAGAPEGEAPTSFVVSSTKRDDAGASATLAFAVPPGRWLISHILDDAADARAISLCMGAPGFDVGPNEVVFAGAFGTPDWAPDLALAPAELALASAPSLTARLRPASYVNGNLPQCAGAPVLYAYEVPGAPFVEGYHWGSRAFAEDASLAAGN